MADETGLIPQVITDTPLPLLNSATDSSQIKSPNAPSMETSGGLQPGIIQDVRIVTAPIANELISTALDTAQRRILGNFQFGKVGALEIGEFQQGVSGDVRISPEGIIGRDSTGLTRFELDNSGQLILRTDGNTAILDGSGLISSTNFINGNIHNNPSYTMTDGTYHIIPGFSFTITVPRAVHMLVLLSVQATSSQINGSLDCAGSNIYTIFFNGVGTGSSLRVDSNLNATSRNAENIITKTYSLSLFLTLPAGTTTMTLQSRIVGAANIQTLIGDTDFTYILFGS